MGLGLGIAGQLPQWMLLLLVVRCKKMVSKITDNADSIRETYAQFMTFRRGQSFSIMVSGLQRHTQSHI